MITLARIRHGERAPAERSSVPKDVYLVNVFSIAVPALNRASADDKWLFGRVIGMHPEYNSYQILTKYGVLYRNYLVSELNPLPSQFNIGIQSLHQQPLLPFIIVQHKRALVRRFQSIATAGIRRLGALHTDVHASRRRLSALLLAIGEKIRIIHLIVRLSHQWL